MALVRLLENLELLNFLKFDYPSSLTQPVPFLEQTALVPEIFPLPLYLLEMPYTIHSCLNFLCPNTTQ